MRFAVTLAIPEPRSTDPRGIVEVTGEWFDGTYALKDGGGLVVTQDEGNTVEFRFQTTSGGKAAGR